MVFEIVRRAFIAGDEAEQNSSDSPQVPCGARGLVGAAAWLLRVELWPGTLPRSHRDGGTTYEAVHHLQRKEPLACLKTRPLIRTVKRALGSGWLHTLGNSPVEPVQSRFCYRHAA